MEDLKNDIPESAPKRRPRRRLWVTLSVLILVLGAMLFAALAYVCSGYSGGEAVRINLPAGTTDGQLRDRLTSQLGSYGGRVYTLWQMMDHVAPHGSFEVKPDMPVYRLARMIARGKETPVRLTFNNMRTVGQLASRVGKVLECDSATFMAAVDSIMPRYGFDRFTAAAAFIPDTYEFYWSVKPAKLIDRLVSRRNDFWNSDRRSKAKALGLNPVQAATIASIVEEETAKADERPLVARLYLNRLGKGMKLQADPTVKFALGDFSLRRILGKHLKVESPYNTYRREGLPPGPIRIADMSAIDAVLNAPMHNYIYMCAREDFSGYHNFSADYATHQANARRYQQALDRRGIKH